MAKKRTRLVIISDLHCGHRVGLTPPEWEHQIRDKWSVIRQEHWKWYAKTADALKPDILIVNGDAIDGNGYRSGGTEQITLDRNLQCYMAAECILRMKAKRIFMIRGTPFHTGEAEDFEDIVAHKVNAEKIGDHEWYNVNGLVFDVKHKVGKSTIPHGRVTPVAKSQLWNTLWADYGEQPKADIVIRSHVHELAYTGGYRQGKPWLALTTPALQGHGSKYGARQCEGHVDFGLVYFDIESDGSFTWEAKIACLQSQKAEALKL